jgi:amidase
VIALVLSGCVRSTPEAAPSAEVEPSATDWLAGVDTAELSRRLAEGESTPDALRSSALARIAALDRSGPALAAVIAVDPAAAPAGTAGALYGLPILVKDNIDVAGFPTTVGSLALAEHRPTDDAFLVARLREAGAIVVGKANLSEWSNFRSDPSSSGWSALGGQARNPHVLDRSPCGSSSGSAVAVAAGYVPFAVGTETDGSILCPASINGIVGIKPTVGLVSRDGIVPIAHSQDTAGPLARTVRDAARLLEVMAAADPLDPAHAGPLDPAHASRPSDLSTSYVEGLRDDALVGSRIGVARQLGTFDPAVIARLDAAVADLQRLGAEVVEIPLALDEQAVGAAEMEILMHEFRPDLEGYLASVAPGLGIRTLEDLIASDEANASRELAWFGHSLFEQAAAHPADPEVYAAAVSTLAAVGPMIDAALAEDGLSAIVAPTNGPAWPIDLVNGDAWTGGTSTITAVSGYPAITVPMGTIHDLPVGLVFVGGRFEEARLLAVAHAWEQGTRHARSPTFLPTVGAR